MPDAPVHVNTLCQVVRPCTNEADGLTERDISQHMPDVQVITPCQVGGQCTTEAERLTDNSQHVPDAPIRIIIKHRRSVARLRSTEPETLTDMPGAPRYVRRPRTTDADRLADISQHMPDAPDQVINKHSHVDKPRTTGAERLTDVGQHVPDASVRAITKHRHIRRRRANVAERLTDIGQHMPMFKPGKWNNRDCKVCSHRTEMWKRDHAGVQGKPAHIKRSHFCCIKCKVHLCIGEMTEDGRSVNNCFYVWYHVLEYWRT